MPRYTEMTKDERQDRKRERLQAKWGSTVAANPRYGGLTILEATRLFLKAGKRAKSNIKPAAQGKASFT